MELSTTPDTYAPNIHVPETCLVFRPVRFGDIVSGKKYQVRIPWVFCTRVFDAVATVHYKTIDLVSKRGDTEIVYTVDTNKDKIADEQVVFVYEMVPVASHKIMVKIMQEKINPHFFYPIDPIEEADNSHIVRLCQESVWHKKRCVSEIIY